MKPKQENRERFKRVVEAWIVQHGARLAEHNKRDPKTGLFADFPIDDEWWLATKFGTLWMRVYLDPSPVVFARFLNPALARDRLGAINFTPYTGKWNHHYDDVDLQPTPGSDTYWCPAWVDLRGKLEELVFPRKEGP